MFKRKVIDNSVNKSEELLLCVNHPEVRKVWKRMILSNIDFMDYGYWRGFFFMLPAIPLLGLSGLYYIGALHINLSNILHSFLCILLTIIFSFLSVWLLDRMALRGLKLKSAFSKIFLSKLFISDTEIILEYMKKRHESKKL